MLVYCVVCVFVLCGLNLLNPLECKLELKENKLLNSPLLNHFRMAPNTRGRGHGVGNPDMPPPPDQTMAQMFRLLMEDRQAAREVQQASIAAL